MGSDKGMLPTTSFEAMVGKASRPLAVWLMAPAGAGHFVKMVHNRIEYGIMAAALRHQSGGRVEKRP